MKFKSPYDDERIVPLINRVVPPRGEVDVPSDLADAFREAGWQEVKKSHQEKE